MHKGVIYALAAAALFGASTPFAKTLVGQVPPVLLAGLLYLGSGIGLLVWFIVRRVARAQNEADAHVTAKDAPWLAGAILFGGIAGPVLLMTGLTLTPAATASLLLNMEGVLTALLAWFVFKENFDRRIFLGMVLIVAGGTVLGWEQRPSLGVPWGPLAIVAACLCWAIDNNLTRKVSADDAVQIAGIKCLVAGIVNLSIALALGMTMPRAGTSITAGLIGFCGYGLSLVLFILGLRHLGTARTGAYFSVAPFVGAIISLLILRESPSAGLLMAGVLMGIGVWLHLTETHEHEHTHEAMEHSHEHTHDEHHQHTHDFPWDNKSPHTHSHRHEPMTHTHAHFPDIHHRHTH